MNILIVDDERNIRLTLRDILHDEGYGIVLAESGEQALERIAEQEFQLVILDVKLPGMDGIQTFENLKENYPDLDVLMISGHSDIETAVKAVKLGAYDFLEKPLSMAKILTAARNVSERHRLLNRIRAKEDQQTTHYTLIGQSSVIQDIRDMVAKVAPTESKVLIRGESGTGKELVAYALHDQSNRKTGPFVTFNSAALPSELVESELFGYEKGAFTGADKSKPGKLEQADGGTIFLDEIGDMSLSAQAKILRVMQEGTFERLGSNQTLKIDVRILAATHRNLEAMFQESSFREDLYYRLNVIPITIPPLRERQGDIPLLVNHFLTLYARELKQSPKSMDPEALELLEHYNFPGNVRELKNLMERLTILVTDSVIKSGDLLPYLRSADADDQLPFLTTRNYKAARQAFEKYYLTRQLERFNWKISQAAEALGIRQPNLSRKIKELGIRKKAD
ncbi:MAG: sigma-54-dependent transcriptional regulator [Fidelibacterota bacterium]